MVKLEQVPRILSQVMTIAESEQADEIAEFLGVAALDELQKVILDVRPTSLRSVLRETNLTLDHSADF